MMTDEVEPTEVTPFAANIIGEMNRLAEDPRYGMGNVEGVGMETTKAIVSALKWLDSRGIKFKALFVDPTTFDTVIEEYKSQLGITEETNDNVIDCIMLPTMDARGVALMKSQDNS